MKSFGSEPQSWLTWFLRGLLVLFLALLLTRLVELQIIKGRYYRTLAEGNRIRKVSIPAPRGQILARGGEAIVVNKTVKKRILFLTDGSVAKSEDLVGVDPAEVITEYTRFYPEGPSFGHITGYVGEANAEEVGKVAAACPQKGPRQLGSLVGRSGLEEKYDCLLRGVDGEELVETDINGQKVRVLARIEPVPGEDLKTHLDYNLQKKVASLLDHQKGGVVISDPGGEVLALFSSPAFDPNIFIEGKDEEINQVLKDENLPLFNRVIGGQFHPGSVFKPLVALAALAEGKVDQGFTFVDPGVMTVDKYQYFNWFFSQYGQTEGVVDIKKGLARSVDTFFYRLGEEVGATKIASWAEKFGLGEKTGIDLTGEIGGLVPTPSWKKKVKGEVWFLGNTYHLAIGQGDLAVTPIGVNQAIGAIGANGKWCQPKVVGEGKCHDLGIATSSLQLVKEGMVAACRPGGTGFTFFDLPDKASVACKTGTAETNVDGKTHAWFVFFSPVDFPDLTVTVIFERGGEGSKVAGPVAREIFDYWQMVKNP